MLNIFWNQNTRTFENRLQNFNYYDMIGDTTDGNLRFGKRPGRTPKFN